MSKSVQPLVSQPLASRRTPAKVRKATSITLPEDLFADLEQERSRIAEELRRPVPMTAVIELLLRRALQKPGACIRKEARAAATAPPRSHVQAQAAAEVRARHRDAQGLPDRIQAVADRFQAARKEKAITLPDFVREVRRLGLPLKPAAIHRFFSKGELDVSQDTAHILAALEAWLSE
jgi:hypothetical protein